MSEVHVYPCRKVDVWLPGKGNSNSHGARPVHLIIAMIKRIRISGSSIQKFLSEKNESGPKKNDSLSTSKKKAKFLHSAPCHTTPHPLAPTSETSARYRGTWLIKKRHPYREEKKIKNPAKYLAKSSLCHNPRARRSRNKSTLPK
jgi:hypothetical protein